MGFEGLGRLGAEAAVGGEAGPGGLGLGNQVPEGVEEVKMIILTFRG